MPRQPAPKRYQVKVLGGTYSALLKLADSRGVNVDELGDELLGPAIIRAAAEDDRREREARYREAVKHAEKNMLGTPLRRDFGL